MAYILNKEREENCAEAFQRYQQYLRDHQETFPPGAFSLATSEWWYLPTVHHCPHDAWLENITVSEISGAEVRDRIITIQIRLLGAYHDGYIELAYPRVFRYELHSSTSARGLGDWRYDEFTLSPNGHLIHEIEWAGFTGEKPTHWIIKASDIQFQWFPK